MKAFSVLSTFLLSPNGRTENWIALSLSSPNTHPSRTRKWAKGNLPGKCCFLQTFSGQREGEGSSMDMGRAEIQSPPSLLGSAVTTWQGLFLDSTNQNYKKCLILKRSCPSMMRWGRQYPTYGTTPTSTILIDYEDIPRL
ncbi:bis(5'-nucleosyl)-tetraphosphatase [Striga asiatica]|uniref:Bis(5'-nucleosyl)-tetraphosphatase n=1 Tax=Striga asiatica TaxID=4170 RepID=A0A5A7QEN2_STRAF|nr:bis(5'-nucleosyl)-tetraphosphatase [Striga asiatica]